MPTIAADEPSPSIPNPLTANPGAARRAGLVGLFSGLRVVVSTTILSRFLGMFRDMATASLFGLGPVMDAFSLAFRIPNLARRLFGEGALSAAFLPAFTRAWERDSGDAKDTAWRLASAVLALLAVGLSLGVGIVAVSCWWLQRLFEAGSSTRLLLGLTAMMLPYTVLICLAAQVTAILHARGEFRWPAIVPIVLNVAWIASIFVIDPWFEPDRVAQAYALAVCVVISGVLQLALQLPVLVRLGFRWRGGWGAVGGELREIARAVVPVALGLSITQITTILDSAIAWGFSHPAGQPEARMALPGAPLYPLAEGATSAIYFGERLYHFPLGVFGVALGTVLFPRLARHAARGEFESLREDLSLGLRLVLTIGLPASVGLMLVAGPLTQAIYARGEFTTLDAARTAGMVAAYSAGVWAYCAIPVLFRGFYAVDERLAPLRVGLAALVLDVILNLLLIWPLGERGLAWSTAISSTLQVGLLVALLQARFGRLEWRDIGATAAKTGVATLGMAVVCYGVLWLPPGAVGGVAVQTVLAVACGIAVFLVVARVIGLREVDDLLGRRERSV